MLDDALLKLNISITEKQKNQFHQYIELLSKWNKTYNLSAIRNKEEMYPYHLYDSLSIATFIQKDNIIDIGSGAGLPGIPLAILFPHKNITLLDSNIKKSRFQRQVQLELKLDNLTVINSRAESYTPPILFDYVISRAFSSLAQMISLTSSLCQKDGAFLAMKGQYPTSELANLKNTMNADIHIESLNVPELDGERHLVIIKQPNLNNK